MGVGPDRSTGVPKIDAFFEEFKKRGVHLDALVCRGSVRSVRVERADQGLLIMDLYNYSQMSALSPFRRRDKQIFMLDKEGKLLHEVGVRFEEREGWFRPKTKRILYDETVERALTLITQSMEMRRTFYVVVFWAGDLVVHKTPKFFSTLEEWIKAMKESERRNLTMQIEAIDAEGGGGHLAVPQ